MVVVLQHQRQFTIIAEGLIHVRTLTGDETLVVWGRVLLFPQSYLLFPHYAQCLPIIPALCSMLFGTYYSQNYASIIRPTLITNDDGWPRQDLDVGQLER